MIARPTTPQLLRDCAREVRESIVPAITDPTILVRLEMLGQLLESCAVRAGHETAWMAEESADLLAYAADVQAAHPDEALEELLDGARRAHTESLLLDDRIAAYDRAGRAFAAALDLAMDAGDEALSRRAAQVVGRRRDHETETRPNFSMPGRS